MLPKLAPDQCTDYIGPYYQHRVDPQTPIEDVVGTLDDLDDDDWRKADPRFTG